MATKQLTLPGEIVKKDNKLIRSKISTISVDASRILAKLIASINTADTEFNEVYEVAIKDFLPDTSGRGYIRTKGLCKELLYAHAEIEKTAPGEGEENLRLIPFFREIRYRKGVISAEFNLNMKPLLLELNACFTKYNLIEYLKLPSIYSQRIFEILKSWSGMPEVILQVKELHHMLNTPDSFRKDFFEFRRRVLEKAHKDITKETDLYYEWEPIKKGRSVESVRFIFVQKRALPVAEKKKLQQQKKQSDKNTKAFLTAVSCWKERGPECRGRSHQKPEVCEVCLRLNSREKRS